MPIYLESEYRDKDEIKRLGGRWDAGRRRWYVPDGVDPAPFARWRRDVPPTARAALEVSPSGETPRSQAAPAFDPALSDLAPPSLTPSGDNKAVGLGAYLQHLAGVINPTLPKSTWVVASVGKIKAYRSGYFLDLVEDGEAGGRTSVQARAIIWARGADTVLKRFRAATGGDPQDGQKLLLRLEARFDKGYGLQFIVHDVDPSATIGDIEARYRRIRASLAQKGLLDLQARRFLAPANFCRVAVIAPRGAAGLADFMADAEQFSRAGAAAFVVHECVFQGVAAADDMRKALATVAASHKVEAFDVLVIIRGGGARADLAWLNDEVLAEAVAHMPLPVLTGIGHQIDHGSLDDVAFQKFDTPSKVIGHIHQTLAGQAAQARANLQDLLVLARHTVALSRGDAGRGAETLSGEARRLLQDSRQSVRLAAAALREASSGALGGARRDVTHAGHQVIDLARAVTAGQREVVERAAAALVQEARRHVEMQRRETTAMVRELTGLSPERTLQRGFALVQDADGRHVPSRAEALARTPGVDDTLTVRFHDGPLPVTVGRDRLSDENDPKTEEEYA
jgi:exodeoxyribonuclease VII large subunit